ncbi:unknown [Bacteroides sp. CAG:598]|nr:unknown [Bacteroides sp. CAG:598]
MVTDTFSLRNIHLNGRLQRFQSCKTYRILFCTFVIQSLAIFLMISITNQLLYRFIRNSLYPTAFLLPIQKDTCFLSGISRFQFILTQFFFRKITLRPPLQQIRRISMG